MDGDAKIIEMKMLDMCQILFREMHRLLVFDNYLCVLKADLN